MLFGNNHKYFLASIVESSQDSIVTINLDMVISTWNRAAELLYGYPAAEAIGKPLTMLTLPREFVQLVTDVERIKEGKQVEVFESERVHKDKSRLFLEVVMSPVKNNEGEIVGISTIARDLTKFREAEEALREREILARLLVAQEEERSRIARDLHDELGQKVTALRFELRAAKDGCPDTKTCEKINQIEFIAQEIDNSVDFIAWELRPAALEGVPLADAIENYVKQWSLHTGIGSELFSPNLKETHFTPEVETALYRIVQESLNNTYKHARADMVHIIIDVRDDVIVMIVVDDGVGFDPDKHKNGHKGMGLVGMKERAVLVGGTAEIESAPGKGTTIYVKVPANTEEATVGRP